MPWPNRLIKGKTCRKRRTRRPCTQEFRPARRSTETNGPTEAVFEKNRAGISDASAPQSDGLLDKYYFLGPSWFISYDPDFTESNLLGVKFHDVNLIGAFFSNTVMPDGTIFDTQKTPQVVTISRPDKQ